jgi:hypothetical protein
LDIDDEGVVSFKVFKDRLSGKRQIINENTLEDFLKRLNTSNVLHRVKKEAFSLKKKEDNVAPASPEEPVIGKADSNSFSFLRRVLFFPALLLIFIIYGLFLLVNTNQN